MNNLFSIDILFNNILQLKEANSLHSNSAELLLKEIDTINKNLQLYEMNIKHSNIILLMETWRSYLTQFGLDSDLTHEYIQAINAYYNSHSIASYNALKQQYQSEINTSTLIFALADKVISNSLLINMNYTTTDMPWNKLITHDLQQHDITKTTNSNNSRINSDKDGKFIPSMSPQGGFILSSLDEYTEKFVQYAVECDGSILNIGSGYGIPERISLLLGAKNIICNDTCSEHLNIITNLTPDEHKTKLSFIHGEFPHNVEIKNNSIKLLGIFRVLHFFKPCLLIESLKKAYDILEPNGILILSAETPYLKNWQKFIPEYESRKQNHMEWPGYISDTTIYETEGYNKKLPHHMHFLDVSTITKALIEAGFSVLKCTTFNRYGSFPECLLLNGNESVGAIAQKM